MKGFLITVVVVLVLALIGWIGFSNDDSTATITIDKQEIKEDTEEAAREIKQAGEKTMEATKEAAVEAEREFEVAPPPQAAP